MAKNPAGKSRKPDNPYLTIVLGTWTWKVLKFWQADGKKPYARAFCAVSSPFTYGSADLGDTYVDDLRTALKQGGRIVQADLTLDQAADLLGVDDCSQAFYHAFAGFKAKNEDGDWIFGTA